MTTLHKAGLAAILIAVVAPIAGFAQTPPSATAVSAAPKKTTLDPRLDSNTIVCKSEDVTGSRLGAKKVCMTRQQWADMAMDSRERLQQSQTASRTH